MNKKLEEILKNMLEYDTSDGEGQESDLPPLYDKEEVNEALQEAFAAGQNAKHTCQCGELGTDLCYSQKHCGCYQDGEQKGRQEVLAEMRKFSKELSCDETCKNNPHSCEMERRMMRAFDIIEERFGASPKKDGVK